MTIQFRPPLAATVEFDELIRDALTEPGRGATYRDHFKRVIDVTLVLVAALPVCLVLLPLCLLIACDGGSPLYRQRRLGKGGREFSMLKLRSMVVDAEQKLEEHLASDAAARLEWTVTQKLRRDPRITRMGRFIRKSSIDELPQLWNVLRGDMALVGPRPMMVSQKSLYPGTAYYALRPGITGYWQTSVRNESSFADRARFDHDYLRDVSLSTDLGVLARTVRVVALGTGC